MPRLLPLLTAAAVLTLCASLSTVRAQDTLREDTLGEAPVAPVAAEASPTASSESPATPDPTGTWRWTRSFGNEDVDFKLCLHWDGEQLTGDYTSFDQTTEIEEATYEGGEVAFTVEREFGGNTMVVDFRGEPAGAELSGTVEIDFGQGNQSVDWLAERRLEAGDVVGVWTVSEQRGNRQRAGGAGGDRQRRGRGERTLTVTEHDGELAAVQSGRFGEREAQRVSIDGGKLVVELSGEGRRGSFKSVYTALVAGDKMKGANAFEFGDRKGTRQFTAERRKNDDEPAVVEDPENTLGDE
ncbi:hypothetical protein Mal64_02860 [Pseudobythopirellula maris]|uniref:Uncharacterized protein n=1 Tax=Pseudobythopirellula maris TaxID=2527991 RepID=A0A5C5ZQY2_9BACT|nr:hypothetical protein [Pseudobythopirellula maris]TWT89904.1 hypothetical protein Mal64_02860 [Pseudobythopirellula maris]